MTGSDLTVLIVEDERDLAALYVEWLSEYYDVLSEHDGEAALSRLDESVDVVLLDRQMPGISGDEVLATIRERGLDCRVAMVTAVAPNHDIIDMGFDEYLQKPIDRDVLYSAVERLYARSQYSTHLRELAALVTKRALLETERPATELVSSCEYRDLVERIDVLMDRTDTVARAFDDEDFEVLFRDL